MVAKNKLTKQAYARQIAGLNPWPKAKRPFDDKLTVGVYSEMLQELRSVSSWADKVRAAIIKIISEEKGEIISYKGDKDTVIF